MLLCSAAFNKEERHLMFKSQRFTLYELDFWILSSMLWGNVVAVQWEQFGRYKLHSMYPLKLPRAVLWFKIQQIMLKRSPRTCLRGASCLKLVSGLFHALWIWHLILMSIFITWQLLVIACRSKYSQSGYGRSTGLCPIRSVMGLQMNIFP